MCSIALYYTNVQDAVLYVYYRLVFNLQFSISYVTMYTDRELSSECIQFRDVGLRLSPPSDSGQS